MSILTEAEEIAKRTVGQSMDVSGEWQRQRHGRLTASVFGEICKRKLTTGFSKLTTKLLYGKYRETKGIRYVNLHEAEARTDYLQRLLVSSPLSSVSITGIHVDTKDCWLGASPDGLVTDPSYSIPNELLEIKCLLRAESTSLHDSSTKKEHCSTFCLSSKILDFTSNVITTTTIKFRDNYILLFGPGVISLSGLLERMTIT